MNTYTLGPLSQADVDYIGALLGQRPLAEARDLANRIEAQIVHQDQARAAHVREELLAQVRAELAAQPDTSGVQ